MVVPPLFVSSPWQAAPHSHRFAKDRPARHTPRPARPPAPSARPGCRANPAGRQPPPPNATRSTPLPTPDDGTLTAPPPPAPRAATVPIPSRGGTHLPGPVCAASGLRRSHVPRPARPRAASRAGVHHSIYSFSYPFCFKKVSNLSRPRFRCDFTVPTGMCMMAATFATGKSSM